MNTFIYNPPFSAQQLEIAHNLNTHVSELIVSSYDEDGNFLNLDYVFESIGDDLNTFRLIVLNNEEENAPIPADIKQIVITSK